MRANNYFMRLVIRHGRSKRMSFRATFAGVVLTLAGSAFAQTAIGEITRQQVPRTGDIIVIANGFRVQFPDQTPIMMGNRVMVPVRGVFEHLHAFVRWMPRERRVVATRFEDRIELRLGVPLAVMNGENRVMDQPPVLFRNRTMVPLRFLSESLGASVVWRPEERTVIITQQGYEVPPPIPPQ
jgi:hypothetical protein